MSCNTLANKEVSKNKLSGCILSFFVVLDVESCDLCLFNNHTPNPVTFSYTVFIKTIGFACILRQWKGRC